MHLHTEISSSISSCYVHFLSVLNLIFFFFFYSTPRDLAKAACDWHPSLAVTVVLELKVWRRGDSLVSRVCLCSCDGGTRWVGGVNGGEPEKKGRGRGNSARTSGLQESGPFRKHPRTSALV